MGIFFHSRECLHGSVPCLWLSEAAESLFAAPSLARHCLLSVQEQIDPSRLVDAKMISIAPAQHVVEYERVVFHDGFNPNE